MGGFITDRQWVRVMNRMAERERQRIAAERMPLTPGEQAVVHQLHIDLRLQKVCLGCRHSRPMDRFRAYGVSRCDTCERQAPAPATPLVFSSREQAVAV